MSPVFQVGEWVRVLGFGFAESDNFRKVAMNRADVTVIYFGPRSENQICGRAS